MGSLLLVPREYHAALLCYAHPVSRLPENGHIGYKLDIFLAQDETRGQPVRYDGMKPCPLFHPLGHEPHISF